jgi:hypothetical protein
MASLAKDLWLALTSTDVVAFIDERLQKTELGQPFRLMDHQRAILREAFTFDADGCGMTRSSTAAPRSPARRRSMPP